MLTRTPPLVWAPFSPVRHHRGIAEELQNECEADLQRDLERLLGPEMAFVYTNKVSRALAVEAEENLHDLID